MVACGMTFAATLLSVVITLVRRVPLCKPVKAHPLPHTWAPGPLDLGPPARISYASVNVLPHIWASKTPVPTLSNRQGSDVASNLNPEGPWFPLCRSATHQSTCCLTFGPQNHRYPLCQIAKAQTLPQTWACRPTWFPLCQPTLDPWFYLMHHTWARKTPGSRSADPHQPSSCLTFELQNHRYPFCQIAKVQTLPHTWAWRPMVPALPAYHDLLDAYHTSISRHLVPAHLSFMHTSPVTHSSQASRLKIFALSNCCLTPWAWRSMVHMLSTRQGLTDDFTREPQVHNYTSSGIDSPTVSHLPMVPALPIQWGIIMHTLPHTSSLKSAGLCSTNPKAHPLYLTHAWHKLLSFWVKLYRLAPIRQLAPFWSRLQFRHYDPSEPQNQ